jgi:hypothetical protein
LIELNLKYKIVGNVIQWSEKGLRPATDQEIEMYWTIQRLLSAASQGSGMPVKAGSWVASEPEQWSCSKCGQGMIAVPGTNRRSFSHACIPPKQP